MDPSPSISQTPQRRSSSRLAGLPRPSYQEMEPESTYPSEPGTQCESTQALTELSGRRQEQLRLDAFARRRSKVRGTKSEERRPEHTSSEEEMRIHSEDSLPGQNRDPLLGHHQRTKNNGTIMKNITGSTHQAADMSTAPPTGVRERWSSEAGNPYQLVRASTTRLETQERNTTLGVNAEETEHDTPEGQVTVSGVRTRKRQDCNNGSIHTRRSRSSERKNQKPNERSSGTSNGMQDSSRRKKHAGGWNHLVEQDRHHSRSEHTTPRQSSSHGICQD